jgi:hypothetical protein
MLLAADKVFIKYNVENLKENLSTHSNFDGQKIIHISRKDVGSIVLTSLV